MERMERIERGSAHDDRTLEAEPRDPREDSGSRWGLWQRLKTAISSEHPAVTAPAKGPSVPPAAAPASSAAPSVHSCAQSSTLDHDRARQLLVAQRSTLLPPADANALSAHLLTCDSCYRFAQDLAARHRQ